MRIDYQLQMGKEVLDTFTISHPQKESLVFDATNFKTNKKDFENTFDEINGYIATLSAKQQEAIYGCYANIHQILMSVGGVMLIGGAKQIVPDLQLHVKKLYDNININDLAYFMNTNYGTYCASDIMDVHDSNSNYSVEMTYLTYDYVRLINLATLIHLMAPIWSQYLKVTAPYVDKKLKEYSALDLLSRSVIVETQEWGRLYRYIATLCNKVNVTLSASLAMLSEEMFPLWAMGMTLVRRLCINKVGSPDGSINLVATIYRHMENNLKLDSNTGGTVLDKHRTSSMGDDEREKGILEEYKMKQEMSEHDIIAVEVFLGYIGNDLSLPENRVDINKMYNLAKMIEPDIDINLVKKCYDAIPSGVDFTLTEHQKVLIQWVLGDKIPPESVVYLTYYPALNAIAVAQAIYWHRKQYVLGTMLGTICLAGTTELSEGSEFKYGGLIPLNSKTKNELDRLYGIYVPGPKGGSEPLAVRTIEEIVDSILSKRWTVFGPPELTQHFDELTDNDNIFIEPESLRYILAEYIKTYLAC